MPFIDCDLIIDVLALKTRSERSGFEEMTCKKQIGDALGQQSSSVFTRYALVVQLSPALIISSMNLIVCCAPPMSGFRINGSATLSH
ncbi:hypothetical protein ACW9YQ_24625 (plasmid) [Paraburkholderia strydomiana]